MKSSSGNVHLRQTKSDLPSILLLLLLYILQGIPLGLISAIPMILQNRGVTYSDQAKFSFAYWPFSMKLLWAPIVDAVYHSGFGRRKSWLVPMQYLIAIFMFVLSYKVDDLISHGNVTLLTAVFFILNFLAATQDIAVDGWALTMLSRHNVGYASTCNSVGQTAGYFLGYVVFLALESPDFCHGYLPTIITKGVDKSAGVISLPGFLTFWAWVFLVTTTLVMICKKEDPENHSCEDTNDLLEKMEEEIGTEGIRESYKTLWEILRLPSIRVLIVFLLTVKIPFSTPDSVTGLKLIESGVPKDRLALLAIPMTPLQILLPFILSKYTAAGGASPMTLFIKMYPIRLLFGLVFAWIVAMTPSWKNESGTLDPAYYVLLVIVYAAHQVTVYGMFVSVMAFFARISDARIGGTYMTLLNTVCNLGGNWPSTLALWLVDPLTSKQCSVDDSNNCSSSELIKQCTGDCVTTTDGYNIQIGFCIIFGFLWLILWGRRTILRLQNLPRETWRTVVTPKINGNRNKVRND